MKGVLITRSGNSWYLIIQAEQEYSPSQREGFSVGTIVGFLVSGHSVMPEDD